MGWFYSPQGATRNFTTSSGFDANIPNEFNSPTQPHAFTIVLAPGAAIGSTVTSEAAVTLSGLPSDSRVRIINNGRIQGAGGDGGKGGARSPSKGAGKTGGGGGGGAGNLPGEGGDPFGGLAAPGAAGTTEAGGAGGTSTTQKIGAGGEFPGAEGGNALNSVGIRSVNVYNVDGEIWGGGGGGAGADNSGGAIPAGAGGDPGEGGEDAQGNPYPPLAAPGRQGGGAPGKAIDLGSDVDPLFATVIIWEGGATSSGEPNVKGEVS